jgi:predicted permease
MIDLAFTIAPIFGLVVLGNVLRRLGMPHEDFWPRAEKLGYWFCQRNFA